MCSTCSRCKTILRHQSGYNHRSNLVHKLASSYNPSKTQGLQDLNPKSQPLSVQQRLSRPMEVNCETCNNFTYPPSGYAAAISSPPRLETLHQSANQGCVTCNILWTFIDDLLRPDLGQDYTYLFIVKKANHRPLLPVKDDRTVLLTVKGPTPQGERITLYQLRGTYSTSYYSFRPYTYSHGPIQKKKKLFRSTISQL